MKFKLSLSYLGYNTVLQTLEIRHYEPVCDVSKTGLYRRGGGGLEPTPLLYHQPLVLQAP